ncbi:pentapeptide repeat-containing protein [Streptomyces aurantiacus]|uniref:pentapeptide repeat-containing protein n=1 Tax=Streptomyces aurantiacus TaxID=47760 RepID=UPI0006E1F5E7|nr:pentapeptide repeat-containing protein [Streptomyces aurantiacus]
MTLVAAGALGWGIYHYAYEHFAQRAADQKPSKPVNINDVLTATVTALTLIGAVLAGLYAYRKQLLAEGDAHRAEASQLADRYTTAAEQLGHDQAAVRLAGVYALARLADDWAEQRQVCIDVLCAYLRMPYEPDASGTSHRVGEREVRQTIIRVIRDHLHQLDAPTTWCSYDFDFTGATFDGGDFSRIHFLGRVAFDRAEFSGDAITFYGTVFSRGVVTFADAEFSSGTVVNFANVEFNKGVVSFEYAKFNGSLVTFNYAAFNGVVSFVGAEFSGGTVTFVRAEFNNGAVGFHRTALTSGSICFDGARFLGGTVDFNGATLSGGTITFHGATLSGGTVGFDGTRFSGTTFDWGPLPVPTSA